MKRILLILLVWLVSPICVNGAVIWEQTFDKGMQLAGRTGKPVLVDFYTDWCGWCKKLDREVFPSANVQSYANQYVFIKVNCERDNSTPVRYAVNGYPTLIIFAPDGQVIRKITGFVQADRLDAFMKEALTKVGPPKESQAASGAGNFDYPEDVVTKAIQYYNLGVKMQQKGRNPQALRFFGKVLQLVPGTSLAGKSSKRIEYIEKQTY
ncbi:MAG: thioredoxin domain-containing protein [Chlamydiota bacterium]|nr:thioredoxin domain-containing protein [Chlamydiota bacterium]